MFRNVRLNGKIVLVAGIVLGLLSAAVLPMFGDKYYDNNLFIPGTNTDLELSSQGDGSDIRAWVHNKYAVEGSSLFINNISQPGTVDTIINLSRGNVGIGTNRPVSKLAVSGLPTSAPAGDTTVGMLCITDKGNIWIDQTPTTPCF
jgi:hypothetical protein